MNLIAQLKDMVLEILAIHTLLNDSVRYITIIEVKGFF